MATIVDTRKRKAVEAEEEGSGEVAMDPPLADGEGPSMEEGSSSSPNSGLEFVFIDTVLDWSSYRDGDVMQQHSAILAEEAVKVPFVGDKEPISVLADQFQSASPIIQDKIKLLNEQYSALRRTRGDGNCFFRSFMFSYLEHILVTQDRAEVDRIAASIDQCKKTLQSLGYADFTFEDFFTVFIEQLGSVLHGQETSISPEELLQRSRDPNVSDYVVMFFRFVTSGEIRRRADFFEPFIAGLSNTTVDQFCKTAVEPMGEESDHVHIIALSDALGVAIRVVYLDQSTCDKGPLSVNHHDFISSCQQDDGIATTSEGAVLKEEAPFVTLLYRPGHYDILYSK